MFDKNEFARILKNISETYNNQRDFAKKSGINRTYLSQYINMKLDKPPKPEILEKLANASNNITTYSELMIVCGYMTDEFKEFTNLSRKLSKNKAYINCYNLLSETKLSKTDIDKMLYYIGTIDIEDIGNNEKKLKDAITAMLDKLPKENRELAKIVLNKYWTDILEYRRETEKFLLQEKELYDPLGLAKIGFSMDDYNPPTDKQREQLAELIKVVLKDNKKDNKKKDKEDK